MTEACSLVPNVMEKPVFQDYIHPICEIPPPMIERADVARRTGEVPECRVAILREFWHELSVEDQHPTYDIVRREADKCGWVRNG